MKKISLELTDDFFARFVSACEKKVRSADILDDMDGVYPEITEQERAEKSTMYLISKFVKAHEINEAQKVAKESVTVSKDAISISVVK